MNKISITASDIEQIAKMYQWASNEKDMVKFSFTAITRKGMKEGDQFFTISSMEWVKDGRWKTMEGMGNTVMETMQDYTTKRVNYAN